MATGKYTEIIGISELDDADYRWVEILVKPEYIERFIVHLALIRYQVLSTVTMNDNTSKVKIQLSAYVETRKQKAKKRKQQAPRGVYSQSESTYMIQMTENELDYALKFLLEVVTGEIHPSVDHIDIELLPLSEMKSLDLVIVIGLSE